MTLLFGVKKMGIETLIAGMPGTVAQGIIYGIMALGIYITFKLLNFADLSVDGSFATGGAVAAIDRKSVV